MEEHDTHMSSQALHVPREKLSPRTLEWGRRNDPEFDTQLKEYLFTEGRISEPRKARTRGPAGF
jgi:hypothetical protein